VVRSVLAGSLLPPTVAEHFRHSPFAEASPQRREYARATCGRAVRSETRVLQTTSIAQYHYERVVKSTPAFGGLFELGRLRRAAGRAVKCELNLRRAGRR